MNTSIIAGNSPISFTEAHVVVNCKNDCNGEISFNNITGGTAPFTYSIDNGLTTSSNNTFSNLCEGSYSLIVEDVNGCQSAENVSIMSKSDAINFDIASQNASCSGVCDGTIKFVNATGGALPLAYSVDGGSSSQSGTDFNQLCAGNYDLQISDANGCIKDSTVEITSPQPLSFEYSKQDALCPESCDGNIEFTNVIGGTPPYAYSIDDGATLSNNLTYSGLCVGNYTLLVSDASSCKQIIFVEIKSDPCFKEAIIFSPNIFTPNGDDANDVFSFEKSKNIASFNCLVVNRWGAKVFEFTDINEKWNGNDFGGDECTEGVYFLNYSGTGLDGIEFQGQGTVTIIRE